MPEWMPISEKENEAVKRKEQGARQVNPCQGSLLFFLSSIKHKGSAFFIP